MKEFSAVPTNIFLHKEPIPFLLSGEVLTVAIWVSMSGLGKHKPDALQEMPFRVKGSDYRV